MKKTKFLTVGELAKKMNVSTRTLQYYDQIDLLKPSGFTEGGRRLYSMKDQVILHQIINLKQLGFSLEDIKDKLIPAETVEEADALLETQEKILEEQMKKMDETLNVIKKFRKEMNVLGKVDWEIFSNILSLLRENDKNYWIVKYFDKEMFNNIISRFDEKSSEEFMQKMTLLCEKAFDYQENNILPDSDEGINLANEWWDMIMLFTDGDPSMLENLIKMWDDKNNIDNSDFVILFSKIEKFISNALSAYFQKNGIQIPDMGGKDE